ncbi:hypothetical protein [Sulfuricurvum sp.]|uniref:hypothetical protein n=1 Tax=Sulfuricurvum sp. TaxID=2025608 RepID=UPI0035656A47
MSKTVIITDTLVSDSFQKVSFSSADDARNATEADSTLTREWLEIFVGHSGGMFETWNARRAALVYTPPAGITLARAILRLWCNLKGVEDTDLVFVKGDGIHPSIPVVVGDFNKAYWGALVKRVPTTTITLNAYNDIEIPVSGLIVDGKIKLYGLSGRDYDDLPANINYGARFDASAYPHPPKIELTYFLPQQALKSPLSTKKPLGQLV